MSASAEIQKLVDKFTAADVRKAMTAGVWGPGECPITSALWAFLLENGLPVAAITGRDDDYSTVKLHFCYAESVEVSLPVWAAVAAKMLATASIVGPVTRHTVYTVLEIVQPSTMLTIVRPSILS